ncbi:hypothetical protein KCU91_g131, partial [Aureobasidium melanogenum]
MFLALGEHILRDDGESSTMAHCVEIVQSGAAWKIGSGRRGWALRLRQDRLHLTNGERGGEIFRVEAVGLEHDGESFQVHVVILSDANRVDSDFVLTKLPAEIRRASN